MVAVAWHWFARSWLAVARVVEARGVLGLR
jgi:hypothetical protein